ncbi:hypothetical protein CSA56_05810 [candidate division KSB3 bacterium]|uniref:Uncharacterized protein n=1 Tax=candidate division KSB3 bacterium TaxID=2044937 RepID=A0A2G6KJ44_9BACT|nr:MAG: hypothetical protein CSA56_05810 [candidate division KSB3 bacterium]
MSLQGPVTFMARSINLHLLTLVATVLSEEVFWYSTALFTCIAASMDPDMILNPVRGVSMLMNNAVNLVLLFSTL